MNCKKIVGAAALLWVVVGAAQAQVVVIGHPGAGTLTKQQVADTYLGKSQALVPVDLPDSSPAYVEFYTKATGKDVAQVKSIWSRIAFTGKGQPPKQLADAAAVKKAVAASPNTVGYIDKAAVDGTVKVLLTLD
jgi:ABC-type phosphate transport system substrate-binding protein